MRNESEIRTLHDILHGMLEVDVPEVRPDLVTACVQLHNGLAWSLGLPCGEHVTSLAGMLSAAVAVSAARKKAGLQ